MLTYYIVGYPRNRDGTVRKNAKRKVLDLEHTLERAKTRKAFWQRENKYDVRIFDGAWHEIID